MAKTDTQKRYDEKQAEYQQLLADAVTHRDREKTIRKEFDAKLKEALKDHGLDAEAISNQKRLVTAELHDLKQQLIGEIVAAVSLGLATKSEGVEQLVALDYTPAAAEIELRRATHEPAHTEAPIPATGESVVTDQTPQQPARASDQTHSEIADPNARLNEQGQLAVSNVPNTEKEKEDAEKLRQEEQARLNEKQRQQEEADAAAKREQQPKPVTAGSYASVSNKDLSELVTANEAAIRTAYPEKLPETRPETIDALVKLGIAPPKKAGK